MRPGSAALALCAAVTLALLPACAFRVPKPPTGPVPADAMVEVPYPPPPARVEVVPPKKNEGDVWIDGQWDYIGEKWEWTDGSWVTPPANAYFTPWKVVRRSDGQLLFARAAWRGPDGRPLGLDSSGGNCAPQQPVPPAREVAQQ